MLETIEKIVSDFFKNLWTDYSEVKIEEEAENIFRVSLKSDDSHLLIGPHGKNLELVTHILKLLVSKKTESHINLHLEINDYLAQKDQKLIAFISSKIQVVQESWKEIILPFFTAYERKKVHSYVSENGKNIYTESRWEGNDRRIHLCKKAEKMTIDLDGDTI